MAWNLLSSGGNAEIQCSQIKNKPFNQYLFNEILNIALNKQFNIRKLKFYLQIHWEYKRLVITYSKIVETLKIFKILETLKRV